MKNSKKMKILSACVFFALAGILSQVFAQQTRQDRSRYYEQLTGNMIQQFKLIQDENARLTELLQEQGRKIAVLEAEYKKLAAAEQTYRQNSGAEKESARSYYRELAEKNRILEEKIRRLEALVREVGKVASSPATGGKGRKQKEKKAARNQTVDCVEHIVEQGHVLYNIARAYQVSVQEIRKINNLKSDKLSIGQKLLIPVKKER